VFCGSGFLYGGFLGFTHRELVSHRLFVCGFGFSLSFLILHISNSLGDVGEGGIPGLCAAGRLYPSILRRFLLVFLSHLVPLILLRKESLGVANYFRESIICTPFGLFDAIARAIYYLAVSVVPL